MNSIGTADFAAIQNILDLVHLLQWRSKHQGDRLAYVFLEDGEREEVKMTYGELDRRARAIAATLKDYDVEGERIVLLYPPGLEYIAGFFGCLYAGAIAVPAYPPNPMRLDRTLPRLQAIASDSQAKLALTTQPVLAMANFVFAQAPDLAAMQWLASDAIDADNANAWQSPTIATETLAFLQYTSGSTQSPRGVTLTHGNLLHNLALISSAFSLTLEDTGVIWLPPYHDMGLIGGILQPIHRGFPVILLSPLAFLQRPMRWLRAISHYKVSVSGGPNFAYDLCARKATPEDIATLDLSHWQVAFNGAEPVRSKTMERFAETFAPSSFKHEAFFPCYGLAEATLIVSGGERQTGPKNLAVQKGSVEKNQAVVVEPTDDAQVLVGCGRTLADQRIVIVDPDTLLPLPDRAIGEIWVKGASVSQGYWNNLEETEKTFGAYLADSDDGPYLRTGDLGFLDGGELYVSGRVKDLIIIDGLNHYPQDIEQTVEGLHPAVRPGCSAAFSYSINDVEHLIVAVELRSQYRSLTLSTETTRQQLLDPEALKRDIRRAVAEQHDLRIHEVILLQSGSIAKTSSGKVQRHAVLADYVNDALTHWES